MADAQANNCHECRGCSVHFPFQYSINCLGAIRLQLPEYYWCGTSYLLEEWEEGHWLGLFEALLNRISLYGFKRGGAVIKDEIQDLPKLLNKCYFELSNQDKEYVKGWFSKTKCWHDGLITVMEAFNVGPYAVENATP